MTHINKESTETYSTALQGYQFTGSQYSNEQRIEAVTHYMIMGTLARASRACDIPLTTLHDWKKTEWWGALAESIRNEKEDEHHAAFSRIIDKATKRAEDALEHGETKLVKTKDGYEERRVPVGAKDALMIAAISYDKKRLSENLPTSITQSEGSKGIQAKLEELSERITETERVGNAKLVTTD
jgi:hypothetical protein